MPYKPTTQQPTIKDTKGFKTPFPDEKSKIRQYHLSVVKLKKSMKKRASKEMNKYRKTQRTMSPPRPKPLPRRRLPGVPTFKRTKRLQKLPPKLRRTQRRRPSASAFGKKVEK